MPPTEKRKWGAKQIRNRHTYRMRPLIVSPLKLPPYVPLGQGIRLEAIPGFQQCEALEHLVTMDEAGGNKRDWEDVATPLFAESSSRDKWDRKPSTGSRITIFQFICLFLKTADKHKLNHTSKNKLLYLIDLLLPHRSGFPSSMYRLKTGLATRKILRGYSVHFSCPNCGRYTGKEEDLDTGSYCAHEECNVKLQLADIQPFSFVTIPIKPILLKMLENGSVVPSSSADLIRSTEQTITSFHQSQVYRDMLQVGVPFLPLIMFSDGATTSQSSTSNMWVLMYTVLGAERRNSAPRLHTIWNKPHKLAARWKQPGNWIQGLLTPAIQELQELRDAGIDFMQDGAISNVKIRLFAYSADCPERWKVVNLSTFGNKFGCVHCPTQGSRERYEPGVSERNVKCYPLTDLTNLERNLTALRESSMVRDLGRQADEMRNAGIPLDIPKLQGVQGISVLSFLGDFDEIKQTPPEPMHLLFEGVMKRVLELLQDKSLPWGLKKDQIDRIDAYLIALQPPKLMTRLPGSVRQLGKIKATVLMAITLYYALPCFHGILEQSTFLTIAKFLASVQYLFSGAVTEAGLLCVSSTLLKFGQELQDALGPRYMSYNVHQLIIHLPEYIFNLGPPDGFWAFSFESLIGTLKRYLQNTHEQNKELAGKVCLSEASDILMEMKLVKSSDPLIKEAMRFLCTNLHGYDRVADNDPGPAAYCRGAGQKLADLAKMDALFHAKLSTLLTAELGGAPVNYNITLYDRCITEKSVRLSTLDYKKSKLHVDCAYERNNGNFYLAQKFLKVVSHQTDQSVLFVCGSAMADQTWGYFGFSHDPFLQNEVFQKAYRCVKITESLELHRTSEVKALLMMLADRDGNELATPVASFFPD